MKVGNTRHGAILASAVLGAGLIVTSVGVAAPALANPAGCTHTVTGSTSANGQLNAYGNGSCSGVATRTLRVEIKHDLTARPDSLVAANSSTVTGTRFFASVSSCDGGNTATYYGRSFFTSDSDYADTAHTQQHTC